MGTECLHSLGRTQFSISETLGRMGTSFWCSDFQDRLGGHAIFVIGQSYSRQPLTNHIAPEGCNHPLTVSGVGNATYLKILP